MKTFIVAELNPKLQFISDSQDVQAIRESIGQGQEYDAFFVDVADGEYTEVWGMVGITRCGLSYLWRALRGMVYGVERGIL